MTGYTLNNNGIHYPQTEYLRTVFKMHLYDDTFVQTGASLILQSNVTFNLIPEKNGSYRLFVNTGYLSQKLNTHLSHDTGTNVSELRPASGHKKELTAFVCQSLLQYLTSLSPSLTSRHLSSQSADHGHLSLTGANQSNMFSLC